MALRDPVLDFPFFFFLIPKGTPAIINVTAFNSRAIRFPWKTLLFLNKL